MRVHHYFLLLRILVLTEYEGKAIMIRGHGGGGEWIWSTEVIDVAGPILTETVRKLFAVTITRPVNAGSALGTNLAGISDWSLERSFVDAFKTTARSISSSTNLTATSGWYLEQRRSDAPKFDAIQTFIAENPIWW